MGLTDREYQVIDQMRDRVYKREQEYLGWLRIIIRGSLFLNGGSLVVVITLIGNISVVWAVLALMPSLLLFIFGVVLSWIAITKMVEASNDNHIISTSTLIKTMSVTDWNPSNFTDTAATVNDCYVKVKKYSSRSAYCFAAGAVLGVIVFVSLMLITVIGAT